VRASSEAEPHPRARLALERGGIPPEGVTGPRARRALVSAALRPSNEAEFRSRAARPTALVGRGPSLLGRDRFECVFGLWIHLCLFFANVNGPPGF
jgi:hypothetical protein